MEVTIPIWSLILFLTVQAFANGSTAEQELPFDNTHELGLVKNVERRSVDNLPNFHSEKVNGRLEKVLGQVKLGRTRRDETQAKKDVEDAEIHSAVAAVHAEQAKENALHALQDEEKIEKDIGSFNTIGKGTSTGSQNSGGNFKSDDNSYPTSDDEFYSSSKSETSSKTNAKVNEKSNSKEDDYIDSGEEGQETAEDDESDEEADAEETIINDGGTAVDIKTSITHDDISEQNSKSNSGSNFNSKNGSSHEGQGVNSNARKNSQKTGSEQRICQGLLDVSTMSKDFHDRLKTLIDREEQIVERLNQFKSSLEKTLNSLQEVEKNIRKQADQLSKVCVSIDENSGTNRGHGSEVTRKEKSKSSSAQEILDSKIHIHTSQGVLPPSKKHGKNLPGKFKKVGRSKAQSITSDSDGDNRSIRRGGGGTVEEIDLENIFWIKSGGDHQKQVGDLSSKSEGVLKGIEDEGQDVLIIPVSPQYQSSKDVAQSLFNTINGRRGSTAGGDRNFRRRRKKLRLRVHRI